MADVEASALAVGVVVSATVAGGDSATEVEAVLATVGADSAIVVGEEASAAAAVEEAGSNHVLSTFSLSVHSHGDRTEREGEKGAVRVGSKWDRFVVCLIVLRLMLLPGARRCVEGEQ